MKKKLEKKNLGGKLTLNKETVADLTHQVMQGIHGGTGEDCESMLFSCDPKKWLCDTSDLVCPDPPTGG
jgi:hypothetical protein